MAFKDWFDILTPERLEEEDKMKQDQEKAKLAEVEKIVEAIEEKRKLKAEALTPEQEFVQTAEDIGEDIDEVVSAEAKPDADAQAEPKRAM